MGNMRGRLQRLERQRPADNRACWDNLCVQRPEDIKPDCMGYDFWYNLRFGKYEWTPENDPIEKIIREAEREVEEYQKGLVDQAKQADGSATPQSSSVAEAEGDEVARIIDRYRSNTNEN